MIEKQKREVEAEGEECGCYHLPPSHLPHTATCVTMIALASASASAIASAEVGRLILALMVQIVYEEQDKDPLHCQRYVSGLTHVPSTWFVSVHP